MDWDGDGVVSIADFDAALTIPVVGAGDGGCPPPVS
eukprot:gene8127-37572_t